MVNNIDSIKGKAQHVLLITNIPTPYRISLFNELHKQLWDQGLILKVIFGAPIYSRRKWTIDMSECQFEWEVLPSKKISYADPEKVSFTYSGLYRIVSKEKPSLIITNAFSLATTKLWFRSWFKNTAYIIWSGAIMTANQGSPLRKIQRKMLVRKASGFVAYGMKAKEYLVSLGAKKGKVEIGINTVDAEFYANEAKTYRSETGLNTNKRHLLYLGHLSPRKNVMKVLEVLRVLFQKRSDIILDIVGDGDDRDRLEKYVDENNLSKIVKFHGFKQKPDIPQYLARSECFLFQTDFDIWGLALVEAMAAGVPCIASLNAGATHDLIQDGITGFAMDFSKREETAGKINWILEHPDLAGEIGENAQRFVLAKASLEKSAAGFVSAITKVLERS